MAVWLQRQAQLCNSAQCERSVWAWQKEFRFHADCELGFCSTRLLRGHVAYHTGKSNVRGILSYLCAGSESQEVLELLEMGTRSGWRADREGHVRARHIGHVNPPQPCSLCCIQLLTAIRTFQD